MVANPFDEINPYLQAFQSQAPAMGRVDVWRGKLPPASLPKAARRLIAEKNQGGAYAMYKGVKVPMFEVVQALKAIPQLILDPEITRR
ncbi:MAG: hypothetical protein ABIH03_11635 [Pseudomonadota bacterium]